MSNGKILKGDVGSGKSRVALAYFVKKVAKGDLRVNGRGDSGKFANPVDVYIITTAKKRNDLDWEGEASPFGISTDRDASNSGIKLTVDSWNNVDRYADVKGAFFIFDEQRLVGSGAWVKAFLKLAEHNEWIILSATPGDIWMDYVPVFVANGFYKNRTEFIRRHVVYRPRVKFPMIDRYVEQGHLNRLRYSLIVDMPFTRHTVRHVENIIVAYNEVLFKRIFVDRWHIYEDRPLRDVSELFSVMRRLVNSDPDRLGATMKLWEKHPRLIIFYNFNYELDALRIMAKTLNANMKEWNGHKHEDVPDGESWIYLVQYTAGAEGWNCITTNAMVFFSLNYSYKINEQAKGRTDRLNTLYTDLYYYILRSNSVIDNAIAKSLITKKNFNEKDLIPS